MIILFINNNSIKHNIDFIHSLFIEYEIKIVFIINNDSILNEINNNYQNNFIFIDYFNDELFKICKYLYNISIYYYSNNYSKELLEKLNNLSNDLDFIFLTHQEKYKYVKSLNIKYINQKNIKLLIDDIFYINKKIENIGFIVLIHVIDKNTNKLWNHCIFQIRQFHNHKIIIIDDNSNEKEVKLDNNLLEKNNIKFDKKDLKDITWIKSDFSKRGEILPYYYLYKNNLFEKAMIIHDSTFLQKKFEINTKNIEYLWHFEHHANDYENEIVMLKNIEDESLIQSYDAKKWFGCFGCQTLITYDFINEIQEKYNVFKLIDYIDSRSKRMNFERVFSLLCTENEKELYFKKSIYGNILEYEDWGLTFDDYINYKSVYQDYDLIKTWCGR